MMLALIGNVARGASTVRSATKMLPKGKKGGALVSSQRPGLSQFYDQARQKKAAAAPTLDRSRFFTAPKIGDAKKGSTNVESAENKISLITNFIRKGNQKRRESFKSYLNTKQDEKRKEKEEKKENFAKGLVKGVASRALAPVKSIFDRILDAVGKIIIAKIGMWAIDNPEAFAAIIKGIAATMEVITDIFIGTVDFLATLVNEGYKLVDGFDDWKDTNLGEDVSATLDNIGSKFVDFLNASLIVGGLLMTLGNQELGKKDDVDTNTPGNAKVNPKVKADKRTRTRRASQEARKRFARRYGGDAARRRFAGQTRGPIKSSITRRGLGRSVTRLGIKMNPGMVKSMKSISKLAKGIKIPIIGPLIMGVTSYLGDGNLGRAVFIALGTGLGELLGTAIPIPIVGTLLGSILGAFVGDLLYDLIIKRDPGAALEKVKAAGKKIFETGKAVFEWLKGGFGRFIESFKEKNQIGVGFAKTTNWLALLNPLITLPLLKDGFFPPNPNAPSPDLSKFKDGASATAVDGVTGGAVSATVGGSEMDLFKRLVLAESGGEGELGMALVARSVMNRAGLIQSGKVGPGMFMANDKSITGVIMGKGQYQPVSDGSINTERSDAQMAKAAAAIKLAKNVDQLKAKLKAAGMSTDEINKLVASTGFRTGSAFNDPSQNVNVVKFKNHFFNTAGNAGLTATSARISTEDNAQQAQIPTNPTPSSPSAAAVSTLSRGSGGSGAGGPSGGGKAQVGDQAIVPIPIPSQQGAPSGGTSSAGGSTSLNSLYMAQLFGFLYKQG